MRYLLAARLRFLDTRSLRGRGMFELYNTSTQIFLLLYSHHPKIDLPKIDFQFRHTVLKTEFGFQ